MNSGSAGSGITIANSTGTLLQNLPKHDGLRRLVQHLNYVYQSEPALWDLDDTYDGFEWIDFHDADNSVGQTFSAPFRKPARSSSLS